MVLRATSQFSEISNLLNKRTATKETASFLILHLLRGVADFFFHAFWKVSSLSPSDSSPHVIFCRVSSHAVGIIQAAF